MLVLLKLHLLLPKTDLALRKSVAKGDFYSFFLSKSGISPSFWGILFSSLSNEGYFYAVFTYTNGKLPQKLGTLISSISPRQNARI